MFDCSAVAAERRRVGSGSRGLLQTALEMRQIARHAMTHPVVRAHAENAVQSVRQGDDLGEIRAIERYIRARVRYTRDPLSAEQFQRPEWVYGCQVARNITPQLDCDDLSLLLAATLGAVGIPSAFRLVARNRAGEWDHVYVVAYTQAGDAVPIDLTLPAGLPLEAWPPELNPIEVKLWKAGESMLERLGAVLTVGFPSGLRCRDPGLILAQGREPTMEECCREWAERLIAGEALDFPSRDHPCFPALRALAMEEPLPVETSGFIPAWARAALALPPLPSIPDWRKILGITVVVGGAVIVLVAIAKS